jgi:glycosyltransferase involved in cell wall biosynthesis
LIPAHDEEMRIAAVVREAARHLPVVVVDDGSADGTARAAETAGARVVGQTPNQGKGAALRTGFRLALDEGAEAVVTLDADGQHDPAEIPKLMAAFEAARPELVIGCRDFRAMPPLRRLANTLGSLTLRLALGVRIRDNQSGYRLVGRRVMEAMSSSGESGFEFEVEMIAECIRKGWRIEWVPIRTIYTGGTSHIRNRDHLAGFVRTAWRLRRSMRRREASSEQPG